MWTAVRLCLRYQNSSYRPVPELSVQDMMQDLGAKTQGRKTLGGLPGGVLRHNGVLRQGAEFSVKERDISMIWLPVVYRYGLEH